MCPIQHTDPLEDQPWCQVLQKQIFIIWQHRCLVCAAYLDVCIFPAPVSKGLRGLRVGGGPGGTPSMFAEVFVLLFLCFWRAFSLYSLLTVSNVPFLFEHLFTYCVIDSDLKRASFILFHSLLCQFYSVFLKWGNSSCTVYSLCRISVIACVCNCLQCCRFPFSFFIYDVFI